MRDVFSSKLRLVLRAKFLLFISHRLYAQVTLTKKFRNKRLCRIGQVDIYLKLMPAICFILPCFEKKSFARLPMILLYDQRMQRICGTLADNGFEVILTGRKLKDSKELSSQPFQQKEYSVLLTADSYFMPNITCVFFFGCYFRRPMLFAPSISTRSFHVCWHRILRVAKEFMMPMNYSPNKRNCYQAFRTQILALGRKVCGAKIPARLHGK